MTLGTTTATDASDTRNVVCLFLVLRSRPVWTLTVVYNMPGRHVEPAVCPLTLQRQMFQIAAVRRVHCHTGLTRYF